MKKWLEIGLGIVTSVGGFLEIGSIATAAQAGAAFAYQLTWAILDKQVADKDRENAGRVDGIVLELRDGKPPRVAYIEVSPITLLSRFSMRLAQWYARRDRRLGRGRGVPFRVPWTRLERDGPTLVMDLDVDATPINAFESWLRRTIVQRIPGG